MEKITKTLYCLLMVFVITLVIYVISGRNIKEGASQVANTNTTNICNSVKSSKLKCEKDNKDYAAKIKDANTSCNNLESKYLVGNCKNYCTGLINNCTKTISMPIK